MSDLSRVVSITKESLFSDLKLTVIQKVRYFSHWNIYSQILDSEQCNACISELIQGKNPAMVTRFGATELRCLEQYLRGSYEEKIMADMHRCSGFFPITKESLDRYCELFLESIKLIDVLGVWYLRSEAESIQKYSEQLPKMVNLIDMEPYFHQNPWSRYLEGKKVLVIHPFAETILENYYNNREFLFKIANVLPAFDLDVVKAVQSITGNTDGFSSWFEAYDWLCEQISRKEFDVAILGCGSYGLPLAGFIKSLSKKAIHLGGATQIMFGIKGKRWDSRPIYQALYNPFWVRPNVKETPPNHTVMEGGAYW
ncbi:MAG TPA: hypothetical protein VE944_18875 [Nostoc sp.]|uniref:hypothetical protein n=1 Tax=Nostoc sp. TaxID=1180 RepID=UPI002D2A7DEB|nr:hypothetical protein [Nostoc sp.]HYX16390.1 hypothetical protein [Nostoc sp.]